MKNRKKVNLTVLMCFIICTTSTYCSDEENFDEFPPYTTHTYRYTKSVYMWKEEPQTLPVKLLSYILETHKPEPSVIEKISQYLNVHTTANPAANKIITPIVVSDITTKHLFDTGITRKKITQELKNDIIITITETWETQNPSYMTTTNILAALATLTTLGIASGEVFCVYFYFHQS